MKFTKHALTLVALLCPITAGVSSAETYSDHSAHPEGFSMREGVDADALVELLKSYGFAGTILVAQGDEVLLERALGPVAPGGQLGHRLNSRWRWASVSKQVTAAIAMQEVAAGTLELNATLDTYLPNSPVRYASSVTIRDLLQHTSGLRQADESPLGESGWPLFYRAAPGSADTGLAFCESTPAAPPGTYGYNNCDYIVLAEVLEAVTGTDFTDLLRERIFEPLGLQSAGLFPSDVATVPGYVGGQPEAPFKLENYGAAGAMYGTIHDLFELNRALLSGDLVPAPELELMWQGDSALGFLALGQWSYPAQLAGCTGAVQLVERRGAVGGVQVRNILLPEHDASLILFTNRSEADFSFGEIWQQTGLSHDLLAALGCQPRSD